MAAAAKERSQGYCERNCLLCPLCHSNILTLPVPDDDKSWNLSCAACSWKSRYSYERGKPLAKQVTDLGTAFLDRAMQAITNDSEDSLLANKAEELGKSGFPVKGSGELREPLRVKLRTKYIRQCRACMCELIVPGPRVTTAKFEMRSLASTFIPRVEVFRPETEETLKFLITNPREEAVVVRLTPSHPETLYIGAGEIELGEAPPSKEAWGPEWLVSRETTASRQAFMARKDPSRGANWAVVDATNTGAEDRVTLFMSVRLVGAEDLLARVWLLVRLS